MILWLGLSLGLPSAWGQVLILQKAFCTVSGKSLNPSSALSAKFYLWLFLILVVGWGKSVPLPMLMSLSLLVSSSITCELGLQCYHPCSSKRATEAERHCTTGVLVFRSFAHRCQLQANALSAQDSMEVILSGRASEDTWFILQFLLHLMSVWAILKCKGVSCSKTVLVF